MALQTTVACRRELPPGRGEWIIKLASKGTNHIDEGSLVAWSADLDDPENADFIASVTRVAGFAPRALVAIRPAGWVLSEVVAAAIACALDGVVFTFTYDNRAPPIEHDANGESAGVATREELGKFVRQAFRKPEKWIERIKQRVRPAAEFKADDGFTSWSDLLDD